MYNLYAVKRAEKKKQMALQKEQKDRAWLNKYIKRIQPELITKHERRITGFAKKMETQPVVLPEQQKNNSNQKHLKSESRHQMPWDQKSRAVLTMRHHNRTYSELKIPKSHKIITEKYVPTIQSFRDRSKDKQINPPMTYKTTRSANNKNFHLNIKKINKIIISESSKSNELQSDHNLSEIDAISINNFTLQNKQVKQFKTEKQIREEEELKALSRDRLYFKSLIRFQDNMKDQNVKHCLRDILVKCKVVKPSKERKRQITEQDLFAQIMKLNRRPSSQLKQ